MLSIEKAMEKSYMGFARHQVIYDENKKTVDFVFLSVNSSFERMTGLKKKDILNRRITEVIPKITEDDFDWIGFYGEIATEGKREIFEQYSYPLEKWYRVEAFSCEPGYFITIFTDISKSKLMENKVIEQTALLSKIFDSFPGFIGLKDPSGRFIMANKALSDQWGVDSNEMIGKTDIEILGDIPEAHQFMKDDQEVFLTGREKIVTSEPVPSHEGQIRWFTTLKMPFIIPGTEENALLFIAADITEQKKLELILQKQKNELKESNEEMEAMNEELRESMEEARKADKAKSEFLSTMSHELRTPLNGVIGFSEILKFTDLSDEQTEYVNTVLSSAKNLLAIISDILDFSSIDAKNFEMHPEKTDLGLLIQKTCSMIHHKAVKKGLTCAVDMDEDIPKTVQVDSGKLRQILLNLLSNAVKFTEKGRIGIKLTVVDKDDDNVRIRFQVTDTGIGIKEENQEIIFKAFQQADMSMTRQYEGTGLGLTISNDLVQKMGSTLNLKSTYGEGSTFYFELLLPYEEIKEHDSDKQEAEILINPLSVKGKTVLIAEDNQINMRYAGTALSMFSKDIRIVKAKDGKEAYKLFLEHRPDLVLMDLIMPGIDGYQATAMIRNRDEQIPIVAMTAKAYREDKEDCLKAGMNDFITKPVTLNQLKETIEKYLV